MQKNKVVQNQRFCKLVLALFLLGFYGCKKDSKTSEPENQWCTTELLRATGEIKEQGFNGALYYIIVENYCTGNDLEYRTVNGVYQPPEWKVGEAWIHPNSEAW